MLTSFQCSEARIVGSNLMGFRAEEEGEILGTIFEEILGLISDDIDNFLGAAPTPSLHKQEQTVVVHDPPTTQDMVYQSFQLQSLFTYSLCVFASGS